MSSVFRPLSLVIDEAIDSNQSVRQLKSDVAVLKSDVTVLKTDVAVLKTDVRSLRDGQRYLGLTMEAMQHDLKLILDAVIPVKARAAQVDQVIDMVDRHEIRLSVVESVVRDRIKG